MQPIACILTAEHRRDCMHKYEPLWRWIKENKTGDAILSFAEIEAVLGFPMDHSFLRYKKELLAYGFRVGKISLKEQTVAIEKSSLP